MPLIAVEYLISHFLTQNRQIFRMHILTQEENRKKTQKTQWYFSFILLTKSWKITNFEGKSLWKKFTFYNSKSIRNQSKQSSRGPILMFWKSMSNFLVWKNLQNLGFGMWCEVYILIQNLFPCSLIKDLRILFSLHSFRWWILIVRDDLVWNKRNYSEYPIFKT